MNDSNLFKWDSGKNPSGGSAPETTAENDFQVGDGLGAWVKKTLSQVKTILGLGTAAYTASTDYAVAAKGVTNGDNHDHSGGDGAQIDHGGLSGLGDDDHPQYVHDTGNETIEGVKTFGSFPVTPSSAPSTDYQVANKKFVDDRIATGWIPDLFGGEYEDDNLLRYSGIDVTGIFRVGTKVKLTQTTVKYFYVVNSEVSGSDTLVYLTGGDDYTLVNAAITSPFYSQQATPEGFPDWFDYTPTITGTTSNTITLAHFSMVGRTVHLGFAISGTGDGVDYLITLPVDTNLIGGVGHEGLLGLAMDNSAFLQVPCRMAMSSYGGSGCYLRFWTNMSAGTWTASGTRIARGFVTYFIR